MFTTTFLSNCVVGLALVGEFGQVNVEILRRGLQYGFRQALLISLGVVFADFIYLNIAVTGVIFLLNRPAILKFLWIVGGIALFYLAAKGMRSSSQQKELPTEDKSTSPFFSGFLLNFLHPTNLIWWITVLGSIVVADMARNPMMKVYVNSLGILVGGLIGVFTLSVLTVVIRQRLSIQILQHIGRGSSVVLFGFSFWFFYNAFVS